MFGPPLICSCQIKSNVWDNSKIRDRPNIPSLSSHFKGVNKIPKYLESAYIFQPCFCDKCLWRQLPMYTDFTCHVYLELSWSWQDVCYIGQDASMCHIGKKKRGEAQMKTFFASGCEHLWSGTLSQPAAVIV